MNKKKLIIVEFKDEVEFFLKKRPELFKNDAIVLSLQPECSAALKAAGIPHRTTLHYFPVEMHGSCLVIIDEMMRRVKETVDINDSRGIEEAYNNTLAFVLRMYLSYIIFTLEVAGRIVDEESIGTIYACRYDGNDHTSINLNPHERILGGLLASFKNSCDIILIDRALSRRFEERFKTFFKSLITFGLSIKESFQLRQGKEPSAVFYSLQYNFESIARSLKGYTYYNLIPRRQEFLKSREKKDGFEIRHLHLNNWRPCDGIFKRSYADSLNRIAALHEKERIFTYKGHDFSELIFTKLSLGFWPMFSNINKRIASLKGVLKKLRPAVVISAMSRELSFALGELAQMEGIPSFLISHGSHVPPKNEFDYREWLDHGKGLVDTQYKYHLLQSPWARAYVKRMSRQDNYHNIYPVIFEAVDRSWKDLKQVNMFPQSRGKRILVHASSPRGRGAVRFYVYETADEYIRNINDLIEATRGMPDVFLVIRFRPSLDVRTEDLKSLLAPGDHYVVATEGKFKDYLEIADLLISFSSTTIEEALINQIPVLQYDGTGRYMHLEGASWKDGRFDKHDSVYWIGVPGELKGGIEWIVGHHFNEPTGTIFKRHVFAPQEARRVEELITSMARLA